MAPPHPWRNWYHCMGNTHGTWLPGDDRGFRTRHHREHVEGDYKFPPPPKFYEALLCRSHELMNKNPVLFDPPLRPRICRMFSRALQYHQVQVVDLSISCMHYHLLARFTPLGTTTEQHLQNLNLNLTHPPKAHPLPRVGTKPTAYDHDPIPRRILGLVHSYTSSQLKKQGHLTQHPKGLWAKRPLVKPIASRDHQLAVSGYIRDHAQQGAAVFSLTGDE